MFVQNQTAYLVRYSEEPEVSITIGLVLEYKDGQWYATNLKQIPISRMTTQVQGNLDSLIVNSYDNRAVTYSAEVDETGHIISLLDIQNTPIPGISDSFKTRAYKDGSKIIVINRRAGLWKYQESPVEKITFDFGNALPRQTLTIDEKMPSKVREKLRELGRMPKLTGVIYSGVEDEAGHIIKLTDVRIVSFKEMFKEING